MYTSHTCENNTVVVLSRYWPTALSVIRSLGIAGYSVDFIASSPEEGRAYIASESMYVRDYIETIWRSVKEAEDPGILRTLLEYVKDNKEKISLFPTDDYMAFFIDRHRAELEPYFLMPHILPDRPYSISQLMDKSLQINIAEEEGFNVPRTWEFCLKESLNTPEDISFPCFCKPHESISGFKGEMAKCNNLEELIKHLRFLKRRNPDRRVLVQEYLDIEYELDISGVSLENDVIIPGVIRKRYIARHERGVTLGGIMLSTSEIEPVLNFIRSMLLKIGYVGMFDLELYVVEEEIYFGEINFRSGGPNFSYFLCGVNLPQIVTKTLYGEKIEKDDVEIKEFGKTFVNETVAWKEFFQGHFRLNEIKKILSLADFKLLGSSDDMRPIEEFNNEIRKEIKKYYLKKLKNKTTKVIKKVIIPFMELIKGYPQRKPFRNKKNSATDSVVIGRNYSSNLCMIRSLGKAGHDVEVIRLTSRKATFKEIVKQEIPEAHSIYTKAFYNCPQANNGIKVFEMLMKLANKKRKKFLFPTDDVSAYIVDQYYEDLKEHYYLPDIDKQGGEIIKYMDKALQKEIAIECGVRVPEGSIIKIKNKSYEIPSNLIYPCFIKPNVSRRTSKKRMKVCDTYIDLKSELDSIAAGTDLDILVEEFIPIKNELSILGICCSGKAYCAGGFVAEMTGNAARRGVSAKGRMLSFEELKPLFNMVKPMLETVNYTGLYDIDFIEAESGEIYFIEINFRYGASGYAITESGVNLPQMMSAYMKDGTLPEIDISKIDGKRSFISEKILIEEYIEGNIEKSILEKNINGADILFIKNDADPKPFKSILKMLK